MKNIMVIFMVVLVLVLCGNVQADTIYVGPGESIQAAINAAEYGDTVQVAAGTYYENISLKDGVAVIGTGPSSTIINGGHSGSVVVAIDCGPDTVLEGFTITNGNAEHGCGMYNENSSPTVTDCAFKDNLSEEGILYIGGGMYNNYSSPTITNCTFTGNKLLYGRGAGMYNYYSNPTVTDCTFEGNTASGAAGGLDNNYSSPIVTNCTFTGNTALDNSGGGMCSSYYSSPTVTNCTFSGNSAGWSGGGMINFSSSATAIVTNCTFSGNSARYGGGMYNNKSNSTIIGCTFSGNSASVGGGGMGNQWSSPIVTNCTFSDNSAEWGGDGMYNYGDINVYSEPTITNCIMWGNTAGEICDEIYNNVFSIPIISYSDIAGCGGGWSGTGIWGIDAGGNMDADPLFVDPGYWDPNDTPTDPNNDFWVDGDYHLLMSSPCIDMGDPSFFAEEGDVDFDGEPRVMGDRVDMGADEVGPKQADFTRDGVININDFAVLSNSWNTGPADENWYVLSDLWKDNEIAILDLVAFVEDWLWEAD